MRPTAPRLLVITDTTACPVWEKWIPAAIAGGAQHILWREKTLSDHDYLHQAQSLWALITPLGAKLLLHNRPHLLPHVAAAGVHMSDGGESLAPIRAQIGEHLLLGRSCHTLQGASQSFKQGADYITLSPLFATLSHPGAPHLGPETFAKWVQQLSGPVLALGGINVDNAHQAYLAGAHGVALIREVCTSSDPKAAVEHLLNHEKRTKA
ncbi:thiamine phosphate synthase [Magnetococcus sp. PR-3]|uniref:thiamine phosphate synthase n=1 Tax=Magnetococcus sp. PR-3 TaxID=3120355 RepID=UPI002FCE02E3